MAKCQPHLNTKYTTKEGLRQLGIKLSHKDKVRFHSIGELIHPDFWTGEKVSKDHPDHRRLNSLLTFELSKAQTYFAECRIKAVPIHIDLVFKEVRSHSFTGYLEKRAKQHKEAEQVEFEYKCKRYLKELKEFRGDVYFSDLTQDFLRDYDNWLKKPIQGFKKENSANTRYKKMEFLGKYWHNALEEGLVDGMNPFKIYKANIKTTPVLKGKLTRDELTKLENLDLKPGNTMLARDLFLFSYYVRGIRFEVVISMPKTAVGERLNYIMNKGGKHSSAKIHSKLKAIIDRYIDNPTDTIFGRFNLSDIKDPYDKRSIIGSENALINKELKTVAELAEIRPFSFHQARHTLAQHLREGKKATGQISHVLDHSRESTTEKYLKKLDDSYLDSYTEDLY